MTDLRSLLDPDKITGEQDGIALTDVHVEAELKISQSAWEGIYDYDLDELERERAGFVRNKLDDHASALLHHRRFAPGDVYLEIGCGPAYVGEHLMRTYGVAFIGIDFNYKILDSLHQYLLKHGLDNHLLIHADINTMPLKAASVDFIYGGGVIEHFADTLKILEECWRVLKPGGTSFNTVPAFNLSWVPLRFYNNIPTLPGARQALTALHVQLLRGRVLERNYGYELSFTKGMLRRLHRAAGFPAASLRPFRFHPSEERMASPTLRELYFKLAGFPFLAPVYEVAATK